MNSRFTFAPMYTKRTLNGADQILASNRQWQKALVQVVSKTKVPLRNLAAEIRDPVFGSAGVLHRLCSRFFIAVHVLEKKLLFAVAASYILSLLFQGNDVQAGPCSKLFWNQYCNHLMVILTVVLMRNFFVVRRSFRDRDIADLLQSSSVSKKMGITREWLKNF